MMGINLQDKIDFFAELISNNSNLQYRCYDVELKLLSASSTEEEIYDTIFTISGCKDYLKQHLVAGESPLVLADAVGLMWAAIFEVENETISRVHVIGPIFFTDISMKNMEKTLAGKVHSVKVKRTFMEVLHALPILSVTSFYQYVLMLYYTITGRKTDVSNFKFQAYPEELIGVDNEPFRLRTRKELHGTWAAEQELLKHIEEGDLNYEDILGKIAVTGSGGEFNLGDPIRQAKTYILIFIALCSRAAMRGGLSPEIAYILSDYYISSSENAKSVSELQTISHTMYRDYVVRVHDMLENPQISKPIQESCNFIQLHSAEKLDIADIAAQTGYSEYYFSKKFKKEMGISVKDYIKETKINRAKILLKSGMSIQDITEELHFNSQSYFTEIFRKLVGMTPAEYRNSNS